MHPFFDSEGGHGGEVGHTGWDNNKYWTGGGPKLYYNDESSMQQQQKQHPVRAALAKVAWKQTQFALVTGVVDIGNPSPVRQTHHCIIVV